MGKSDSQWFNVGVNLFKVRLLNAAMLIWKHLMLVKKTLLFAGK